MTQECEYNSWIERICWQRVFTKRLLRVCIRQKISGVQMIIHEKLAFPPTFLAFKNVFFIYKVT